MVVKMNAIKGRQTGAWVQARAAGLGQLQGSVQQAMAQAEWYICKQGSDPAGSRVRCRASAPPRARHAHRTPAGAGAVAVGRQQAWRKAPAGGLGEHEAVHQRTVQRGQCGVHQVGGISLHPHIAVLEVHCLEDAGPEEVDVGGQPRARVPCSSVGPGRRGGVDGDVGAPGSRRTTPRDRNAGPRSSAAAQGGVRGWPDQARDAAGRELTHR